MFAMLHGAWPRVTASGELEASVAAQVRACVAAQVAAGMGFVTDGGLRWPDASAAVLAALAAGDVGRHGMLVRAWRATQAASDQAADQAAGDAAGHAGGLPAAQAVPGPYSLGMGGERTMLLAAELASELAALADAGCPVVIVGEPGAVGIGPDPARRALFAAAQRRLLVDVEGVPGLHPMLAITGGSAAEAGAETIFAAPYRSHLFDLITGPDNWRLIRMAPPERGIVCGALAVGPGPGAVGRDVARAAGAGGDIDAGGRADGDQLPLLVWAARYAASGGGRGLDRVGLANATPLGGMDPATAQAALAVLGRAAALAAMPLEQAVEAGLDPRTIGSRTAALGPGVPRPPRRRRRAVP